MTRTRILSTLTALVAAAASVALAGPAGGTHPHGWEQFAAQHDTDGDGAVTREELAATSERFAKLDGNADGRVTEAEFRDAVASRMFGHLVRWADADGDGAVAAGEWQAWLAARDADGDGALELPQRRHAAAAGAVRGGGPLDLDGDGVAEVSEVQQLFDRLDADRDGGLSATELPADRHSLHRRHAGFAPGKQGHGRMLEHLDSDGDGTVSRAEWDAFAPPGHDAARRGEHFAKLDANGDGVLSGDELAAGHHFHGRHPARPRDRG